VREQRRSFFGQFSQVRPCDVCHGTGEIPNKVCAVCRGAGRVSGERSITINVLPGIQNDQIIKVTGAGEAGERGAATGDLYARIRIKPHQVFSREGDDLIIRRELKVIDLLLGKKVKVPTIEGGEESIDIPANFNLKENLRIPGKGMPHFGRHGRGDLLVDFIIKAPKKLSGKEREILEDLE
jgi:molecular chaperone DnaJ